jgi:hypothetical protein
MADLTDEQLEAVFRRYFPRTSFTRGFRDYARAAIRAAFAFDFPSTTGATMNAQIQSQLASLTTVEPGTPMEGGFLAGYVNLPDGVYGIVVAPKAAGEIEGKWLPKRKDVPGARSCFDGRANTLAMAEAGSHIAQRILGLDIGGFTDWYLPSRDELEVIYRALKPMDRENDCSFRDGDNASSIPVGYPYTEASPAQTTAEAFRAGGAEAFEASWYWASTQSSAGFAWHQYFASGYQDNAAKLTEFLARAVRRFKA